MRKRLKGFQIKTQIIVIYITVLILSFLLTFGMISIVNRWYTEHEIGSAGVQTVDALIKNLSFIFDNVTQFSNYIYFDDTVQESLENCNSAHINPVIQRNITKSLVNMILSGDYISSVFIFDKYLNKYNSYKVGPIQIDSAKIKNTEWYARMKKSGGNGFFIQNSEEVLMFPTRPDKKYISYIREIGNKENYEPLAILLVTIDAETIQSYFDNVSATNSSRFFIVDESGNYIIPPGEKEEEYRQFASQPVQFNGYRTAQTEESRVMVVSREMNIQDWRLVGVFDMNDREVLAPYYTTVIVLIMCLNIVFVFICSLLLTRLIFAPLSKIEGHMMLVEKGEFVEMYVPDDCKNEIVSLKRVFNHMIRGMKNLLNRVKEEEQIIAKGELDLLHAQINPHFLYNTLDAVSALALTEDHENCFKMTQALGSFYRNSLNSGMDFILIRDELQCINSYLTILNIRYDEKIEVIYDVEEDILDCYILKLLLQPLVENAVHHGIKENGGEGTVRIRAWRDENELIFMVTDDGCGMEEDRITEVLEGRAKTGKSGFGIFSLIQRLRLYYHIERPVTIHSEKGSGTEVTVRVTAKDRSELS